MWFEWNHEKKTATIFRENIWIELTEKSCSDDVAAIQEG